MDEENYYSLEEEGEGETESEPGDIEGDIDEETVDLHENVVKQQTPKHPTTVSGTRRRTRTKRKRRLDPKRPYPFIKKTAISKYMKNRRMVRRFCMTDEAKQRLAYLIEQGIVRVLNIAIRLVRYNGKKTIGQRDVNVAILHDMFPHVNNWPIRLCEIVKRSAFKNNKALEQFLENNYIF